MVRTAALSEIGALVGDPGRANMLLALLNGRALTAQELAGHAGVTPQTASVHLAKLLAAGLIVMERQGRHRHHRIASAQVARMLETMAQVAAADSVLLRSGRVRLNPKDLALRAARTCYDHLAGKLGVALADSMVSRQFIEFDLDGAVVTTAGKTFLREFGIDTDAAARGNRAFCRPCQDWSERRPHLAGVVGAEIMHKGFALGWVRRLEGTRAVTVTPAGQQGFPQVFGVSHDSWT
jgi:DNA-binding transcriptional ArsR family regulator